MSINVSTWTIAQVAEWVSGLGVPLQTYAKHFLERNVNGQTMLTLMAADLARFGVKRVGDQMLLYDAIKSLASELDSGMMTLQKLASNLAVRCRNYRSELSRIREKKRHIPTSSLCSASFLMDSAKALLRWLTRSPFVGNTGYDATTKLLVKHCFECALLSQRESFAHDQIEEVMYLCTKIIELCDDTIKSKDSLVYLPAGIDVITLRKRHKQDWGLQFESTYFGIHQVSGVQLSSPAQQNGHLERGDEILQINHQTVIGWPQINVVNLLLENSNEVILTIKRRPRHTLNVLGHIYLRPHKAYSRKKPALISPIYEKKEIKQSAPKEAASVSVVPAQQVSEIANARFWKLYPRPKNLIKRRATVTGASPTSSRPPVTFFDEQTGTMHYNKQSTTSRPPLDKSRSAPEKSLKKQANMEGLMEDFEHNNVFEDDDSSSPPSSITVHSGSLHMRQSQYKFGPRWTRFHSVLTENRLEIGETKKFFLKSIMILPAQEVHSRPFAFKIFDKPEKSVTYLAAESKPDFDMWMHYLTGSPPAHKLNDKTPPSPPPRPVYKRSFSVGSSPSRNFTPPSATSSPSSSTRKPVMSVAPKLSKTSSSASRIKSEWLRSQSVSKLEEMNKRSNISSITISSVKRNSSPMSGFTVGSNGAMLKNGTIGRRQSITSVAHIHHVTPTMGVSMLKSDQPNRRSRALSSSDDNRLVSKQGMGNSPSGSNTQGNSSPKIRCPSCGGATDRLVNGSVDVATQTE